MKDILLVVISGAIGMLFALIVYFGIAGNFSREFQSDAQKIAVIIGYFIGIFTGYVVIARREWNEKHLLERPVRPERYKLLHNTIGNNVDPVNHAKNTLINPNEYRADEFMAKLREYEDFFRRNEKRLLKDFVHEGLQNRNIEKVFVSQKKFRIELSTLGDEKSTPTLVMGFLWALTWMDKVRNNDEVRNEKANKTTKTA